MHVLFVVSLFLASPASWAPGDVQSITAEGKGIIVRDDRVRARNEALKEALKNAVQQAAAGFLPRKLLEENLTLLDDRVYSRSSEYIRAYRILEEKEENNLYVIRIEAQVGAEGLEKDLSGLGLLASRKQFPRVMIIVMEQNIGDQSLHSSLYQSSVAPGGLPSGGLRGSLAQGEPSVCETALAENFREEGLTIVDPSLAAGKAGEDKGLRTVTLDDSSVRRISEVCDADVAVYGRAVVRSVPGTVPGMITAQADVSIRAVRAGSGKILASSIGHGIGVNSIGTAAGTDALKRASGDVSQDMIKKILGAWGVEGGGLTTISVTATGITRYALLDGLLKALKQEIKGVKSVGIRSLSAGVARLDVEFKGSAPELASELAKKNMGGLRVVCEEKTR